MYSASDRLDDFVDSRDAEQVNRLAHYFPLDGPVPFDLYTLPPLLLEHLCRDGVPVMPSSAAEADRVMDEFWPTYVWFYREVSKVPHWAPVQDLRDRWAGELRRQAGRSVDPAAWRHDLAVHKMQLARGNYDLDYVSGDRVRPENVAFSLGLADVLDQLGDGPLRGGRHSGVRSGRGG